ncbi:MAG: hypothetical protein H6865_05410 [Rhodospirillales bacterium]|nr:hypothetical protein [Alphaproteobacteria bacterium]MCB9987057.1 hypothetical protein [Rhodospirillales bacterium]USO08175.1 MAG: hypothetical protein H6866_02880 [Rhodospirillales bacterium]
MFLLNTTLLREKFTVHEDRGSAPMVAQGNRIFLPLISKSGQHTERMVVRGHNMHTTLRMAAMIVRTFYRDGPVTTRSPSYPWGPNWLATVPDYETETNPNSWVAVYQGGRCIYKNGAYHPFMDVIEQCDARNRDEYDRAVKIAEDAFNMAGRGVTIDHNTTIAMVIGAMAESARVGLIYRNPRRSTTFNFTAESKGSIFTKSAAMPEPHQCLLVAAAWLELVQLAVTVGFFQAKRGTTLTEAPGMEAAQRRLGRLNAEITQFEESFNTRYRPERPDMLDLIDEAAAFARGDFQPVE